MFPETCILQISVFWMGTQSQTQQEHCLLRWQNIVHQASYWGKSFFLTYGILLLCMGAVATPHQFAPQCLQESAEADQGCSCLSTSEQLPRLLQALGEPPPTREQWWNDTFQDERVVAWCTAFHAPLRTLLTAKFSWPWISFSLQIVISAHTLVSSHNAACSQEGL